VYKVAIIGPESTGKSTLARELAEQFKGTYVPEYARGYVERKGRKELTYDEVCEIAREQIRSIRPKDGLSSISEAVHQAKPVFFDTELIVTKVWLEYAFGKVPEWLVDAIKTYPMDLYLLTYPDIPWVPDPARYNGSQAMREELFDRYEEEIKATGVPYYVIRHDL
jgi:NadR type nicotinamide-nucleotide adenylyltransferase